ncbi:18S pre-ribosomal assembly protein gar2-related [Quillaja saponaria]|nr:18S pre-ribosomal assembly protein gar2-related [Quillaja saponaria]
MVLTWTEANSNNCDQPPETGTISRPENVNPESQENSRNSYDQQDFHRESKSTFFSVGHDKDPLTRSGSASHRPSTSSTGSSHSFAFPILTEDYNGSPVRMATADRRQLQKHRGWRICYLCCKF